MKKVSKRKLVTEEEAQQERFAERYFNKSRKIISKYFQDIDSLPGAPKELEYFKDILQKIYIDNKLIRYKKNEKFVTSFCAMVPQEIIRAAGARPLTMCSTSFVEIPLSNESVPISICPLVRSLAENIRLGLNAPIKESDIFIVPLACDCKKVLAKEAVTQKPTFSMQIPFNRFDDDGMNLYVDQLKNVAKEISKTIKKATPKTSFGENRIVKGIRKIL